MEHFSIRNRVQLAMDDFNPERKKVASSSSSSATVVDVAFHSKA
jgi:hypothetical protein